MTQRFKRHFFLDTPDGPLLTSAPTQHSVLPNEFKSAAQRSLVKGSGQQQAAAAAGGGGGASSPSATGPVTNMSVSHETRGPKLMFSAVAKPNSFAAVKALKELDRGGTAGGADVEAETAMEKEQLRLGLVDIKPCGLCKQPFRIENLPYGTSLKAILEQRARWGMTSLRKSDVKPGNLYASHRLCSFCAQFFDIASGVDKRRLHEQQTLHSRREHGLGSSQHETETERYQARAIRHLLQLPERETRASFRKRIRQYRTDALRGIQYQREQFHDARRPRTADPYTGGGNDDDAPRHEDTVSYSGLAVHECTCIASNDADDGDGDDARPLLLQVNTNNCHAGDDSQQQQQDGRNHSVHSSCGTDDDDDENGSGGLLDADEMMRGLTGSGANSARSQQAQERRDAEAQRQRIASDLAKARQLKAQKAAAEAAHNERRPRSALTASFLLLQKSTKEKLAAIAHAEGLAAESEKLAVVDDLVSEAIHVASYLDGGGGGSAYSDRPSSGLLRPSSSTGGNRRTVGARTNVSAEHTLESVMTSLRRIRADRVAKQAFYLERRTLRVELESTSMAAVKKRKEGLPPGTGGNLERFAMYKTSQRL